VPVPPPFDQGLQRGVKGKKKKQKKHKAKRKEYCHRKKEDIGRGKDWGSGGGRLGKEGRAGKERDEKRFHTVRNWKSGHAPRVKNGGETGKAKRGMGVNTKGARNRFEKPRAFMDETKKRRRTRTPYRVPKKS